ncbi:MAG: type IV pili methyl-accepting chemotaxis transducer N-terminal domain-containing protein [Gammaproteobacteria bacterium]|nr:type IV pili methyl-accepting chemotaxis transducer N-terminal domain-containing protein [Gammaproteobacteria bacterium]
MEINPRKTLGRDRELVILIGALVTFIVLLALNFGYVGQQSNYDKEYISLAGELRVLSQRIAKNAEAAVTRSEAFPQLKDARDQFAQIVSRLKGGNTLTGLPPTPDAAASQLGKVEKEWKRYGANADVILSNEQLVKASTEFVKTINEVSPKLTKASEGLLDALIKKGAPVEKATQAESERAMTRLMAQQGNIAVAGRLVALSQQIAAHVNKVFQGGRGSEAAAQAADLFRHDAAAFVTALEGMRSGNEALRITRVEDPDARKRLDEIADLFGSITQLDLLILEKFPDLFKVQDAAKDVFESSDALFKDTTDLVSAYAGLERNRTISATTGYILGAFALVLLITLGYKLRRDALARLAVSADEIRRNQTAIMRLLDEMANLADGDLTARATVTEDITGAIADAVNYAIDALRTLVTNINEITVHVSSAAQETQATAIHLAQASDHQAQQITDTSAAINEMAVSIEEVSANAAESAAVAQNSVEIAGKGATAVQNTIQGMDSIREQIQETSKRIKRLGESSQEIGDIVELINDIADQTNILALNAAIQAAMAGEAGRGFAVVADEVQRLAERSSNATKQIDALVKTIQTDTNEAIISMEQSTSGVVNGAKLAQDAGAALKEIESVSSKLAGLIQSISHTARQQAFGATSISNTMNEIREVTTQTSVGSNETAASIGNLADLANDLRKSVAGFKLPS